MVRVRCIHRYTKREWLSEPMRLQDALLWIADTDDCFSRLDFEILSCNSNGEIPMPKR